MKEEQKCVHDHTEQEIAFYGCETNPAYTGVTVATPKETIADPMVERIVEEIRSAPDSANIQLSKKTLRELLLRFKKEVEGEMAEGVIDDLDSIIDFVSGTDSEITEYVKEMKPHYRALLSK